MEQGLWRINFTLIWTRTLDVVTRSCFVYPEHFKYYWFFPNNKSMESKDCIQCALNLTEATNQIQQNMFPMKKKKITEWNRCCSYRKLIWCCFGKSSTISHDFFFRFLNIPSWCWTMSEFDIKLTSIGWKHVLSYPIAFFVAIFDFCSVSNSQVAWRSNLCCKHSNIQISKHQNIRAAQFMPACKLPARFDVLQLSA